MQDWISRELETSDIGDARLDARYRIILDELSQKPSFSIPTACSGWNVITGEKVYQNHR